MKLRRFLLLALSTSLMLFLAGAALQTQPPVAQLRAGAAASNITLPLGATNGGVIAKGGRAVQIHDELRARCLVLDDGKTRLAFAICDLRMIGRSVVERAKQLIEKQSKLSPENVLIAATHTHAAPAVIGIHDKKVDRDYANFLAKRIADGVQRAINNLAPAKLGWAVARAPQHVFNRRWIMKPGTIPPNPFGVKTDRVRMNPPRNSPNLLEPAGPTDTELAIISVQHAGGRPLALLANYSVHYIGGYEARHVSADYFGIYASRVQQLLQTKGALPANPRIAPFVGIMSNGTSGDINNINFRKPNPRLKPWVKMHQVADDLAKETMRAYPLIKHRDDITLDVATTQLHLPVRRPDAQRLAWAKKTLAENPNPKRLTRPLIYAQEALALDRFPANVPVKLQAMRIGNIGVAAIPCEVFAQTGLDLKKDSAFKPKTFTIELANGYNGYLPTPKQHGLGGYETWPARSSYLEVQAEPKIRRQVLQLFNSTAALSP